MTTKTTLRLLTAAIFASASFGASAATTTTDTGAKPSVVIVHGAFAASSGARRGPRQR